MQLRHLRYFVAVAEEQNVTRAAARLHVAQPAISRQVRDLEDHLGVPLLERSAKSVRLTEAGRLFVAEAKAVLARADQAVAAVRSLARGETSELHVGYAPSLTVQILPRVLRRYQAAMPQVRVLLHDLSTSEMLAGLREDRLHVALTARPGKGQLRGLRFHEIDRYPLCVAVAPSHPLAGEESLTLRQLIGEPLVGYSRADFPEYQPSIAALFAPLGHEPRFSEEHDSVTSLIAAVEVGRGVALVPSCMSCFAGPRLKLITLDPPTAPIVVGAISRDQIVSPAVQRFIADAEAAASDLSLSIPSASPS